MLDDFQLRWGDGSNPFNYQPNGGPKQRPLGIPPKVWLAHSLDPRMKNSSDFITAVDQEKLWDMLLVRVAVDAKEV